MPECSQNPNHVVQEIRWADKLDLFNHCPHFPFFMTQDEAESEAEVCVFCCQKRSTITVCGECEEHYCAECIDIYTRVGPMLFAKYHTNDIWSC